MEWFADNGWLAWVGLALVLAAIEVATVTFFFLMLTGGALAGAVAAATGLGLVGQVVTAAVVALLLTALVRPPLLHRLTRSSERADFGAAANIGRQAVVLEPVSEHHGRIKLAGEVWSARSAEPGTIPPGHTVQVVSLAGATAVVRAVAATGSPVERP